VSFGEFGLKAVGRGRITARQIEAARRNDPSHQARWSYLDPRFPGQADFEEACRSMGNGKGNPEYYVAEFSQAKCCTKWMALMKRWRAKRSAWPLPNCHWRRRLSYVKSAIIGV
jgi:hypothetical protein